MADRSKLQKCCLMGKLAGIVYFSHIQLNSILSRYILPQSVISCRDTMHGSHFHLCDNSQQWKCLRSCLICSSMVHCKHPPKSSHIGDWEACLLYCDGEINALVLILPFNPHEIWLGLFCDRDLGQCGMLYVFVVCAIDPHSVECIGTICN